MGTRAILSSLSLSVRSTVITETQNLNTRKGKF